MVGLPEDLELWRHPDDINNQIPETEEETRLRRPIRLFVASRRPFFEAVIRDPDDRDHLRRLAQQMRLAAVRGDNADPSDADEVYLRWAHADAILTWFKDNRYFNRDAEFFKEQHQRVEEAYTTHYPPLSFFQQNRNLLNTTMHITSGRPELANAVAEFLFLVPHGGEPCEWEGLVQHWLELVEHTERAAVFRDLAPYHQLNESDPKWLKLLQNKLPFQNGTRRERRRARELRDGLAKYPNVLSEDADPSPPITTTIEQQKRNPQYIGSYPSFIQ